MCILLLFISKLKLTRLHPPTCFTEDLWGELCLLLLALKKLLWEYEGICNTLSLNTYNGFCPNSSNVRIVNDISTKPNLLLPIPIEIIFWKQKYLMLSASLLGGFGPYTLLLEWLFLEQYKYQKIVMTMLKALIYVLWTLIQCKSQIISDMH